MASTEPMDASTLTVPIDTSDALASMRCDERATDSAFARIAQSAAGFVLVSSTNPPEPFDAHASRWRRREHAYYVMQCRR